MSILNAKEQTCVRAAMQFLRSRCGGWVPLSKALRCSEVTLRAVARGDTASPNLAVRIAKLASVGVDDVLTGRFPAPGTCPMCGHHTDDVDDRTTQS